MRNEKGRYLNVKAIADIGPNSAHGCPKCKYGIADAMPLTRVTDITTERIVQMDDGLITFCDCQAGKAQRSYLARSRDRLIDEACKSSKMSWFAQRGSHPDLDNARAAMLDAQPVPTFQTEPEPEPA